jgi:phospholipid/cholesterol/gamma-HCH transport system substrate-binding protein
MNRDQNAQTPRSEPLRYRYRSFFVGLFILIPLLSIPIFILFAVVKSDFFEKWRIFHVQYQSSEGLQNGNAVIMRGIAVGHVDQVSLNEQGSVDVTINVKRRYGNLVKKSSVARLKQKSFVVGDWEIELTAGLPATPLAADGDTLAGELPIELGRTVEDASSMVASVGAIVKRIENGEGVLGRMLKDDSLVGSVDQLLRKANNLMAGVNGTVNRADAMIAKLSQFAESGKAATDSFGVFARNAEDMLVEVHGAVGSLDTLMRQAYGLPRSADTLISVLKKDLQEAGIILKALENHWLLRRAVRKAREEEKTWENNSP